MRTARSIQSVSDPEIFRLGGELRGLAAVTTRTPAVAQCECWAAFSARQDSRPTQMPSRQHSGAQQIRFRLVRIPEFQY